MEQPEKYPLLSLHVPFNTIYPPCPKTINAHGPEYS